MGYEEENLARERNRREEDIHRLSTGLMEVFGQRLVKMIGEMLFEDIKVELMAEIKDEFKVMYKDSLIEYVKKRDLYAMRDELIHMAQDAVKDEKEMAALKAQIHDLVWTEVKKVVETGTHVPSTANNIVDSVTRQIAEEVRARFKSGK